MDQPERTARLSELAAQLRRLEHDLDAEIDWLTANGVGWPAIGDALGVTRQAARQRHHRRHGEHAPQVTAAAF